MPIPVIRPSGMQKKPLPPGVDPHEALRMSQTQVFRPKGMDVAGGDSAASQGSPGSAVSSSGVTIQIAAAPIIQSLPGNLVDPNKLSAAQIPETFTFEAGVLLPQLTSGRITVPLELILDQIGGEITRAGVNRKEAIRMPLPDVVASIPPELLIVEGQVRQEIDPNFVESPFSEGKSGTPAEIKILEPPRPEPQIPQPPPQAGVPAPIEPPKLSVRVDSPAEVEPPAGAEQLEAPSGPVTSVRLFLISLLKRLPEDLLAIPRQKCLEEAGEQVIELPIELVLPKLASGRIAIEYSALHPFFPAHMVNAVNSVNQSAEVVLPLDRIVAQIPADMIKVEGSPEVKLPDDSSIPANLFTEKSGAGVASVAATAKTQPAAAEIKPEEAADVPAEQQRSPEPKDLEICPTAENFDEAVLMQRVNRFHPHEFTELNGVSFQVARKILDQRDRVKTLSLQDLKDVGVRRKSLLRLSSMPEPAGAVNVSALNRLLTLADQRTLKVQEIIDTAIAKFEVVAGMMVAEDGLVLAGRPPEGFDKQMISAFIPQIFRHLARGIEPAGAGKVSRVTILLEKRLVSFFRAPGVFLLLWHSGEKINRGFFKRVERLAEELSRQNLSAA